MAEHIDLQQGDPAHTLARLASMRIPFGKYKGRLLVDIPTAYYQWMAKQGFPENELGQAMLLMYHMKMDGSAQVLRGLAEPHRTKR